MADEKPARKTPHKGDWRLFVLPAILAAIGAYFVLSRPAPNEAQSAAAHALETGSAQPHP